MFGSTSIRYLSPSEEFYAKVESFIGLTVTLRGPVDVGAMAVAFETLLRVHPAHAGYLERGADGRHQIMVDEYEHEGMWLERIGDTSAGLLIDCDGLPRPIVVSPRVLSACARKVGA